MSSIPIGLVVMILLTLALLCYVVWVGTLPIKKDGGASELGCALTMLYLVLMFATSFL